MGHTESQRGLPLVADTSIRLLLLSRQGELYVNMLFGNVTTLYREQVIINTLVNSFELAKQSLARHSIMVCNIQSNFQEIEVFIFLQNY